MVKLYTLNALVQIIILPRYYSLLVYKIISYQKGYNPSIELENINQFVISE